MVEGASGLMCVFWAGGMYDKRLEMRYIEGIVHEIRTFRSLEWDKILRLNGNMLMSCPS